MQRRGDEVALDSAEEDRGPADGATRPRSSIITDDPHVLDRVEWSLAVAGVRTVRRSPRRLVVVARGLETEVLVCAGITFDVERSLCSVDGRSVPLTPREATVLAALMRSWPTPLSREDLLGCIWGDDSARESNVAAVHLSNLRRKLGRERFQTIRNVGVRLRR